MHESDITKPIVHAPWFCAILLHLRSERELLEDEKLNYRK